MTNHPVGDEFFHEDRGTDCQRDGEMDREKGRWRDMTNIIVAFRNLANAPKIL